MHIDKKYLEEESDPERYSHILEKCMVKEVVKRIVMKGDLDTLVNITVVLGVNRSATAAIATALLGLDYFVSGHSQPFKSTKRDFWNILSRGYGVELDNKELFIPHLENKGIVIKETNGGKRQCDYSDPFTYLLRAGYPLRKITGVVPWRDPLEIASSWARLGGWNKYTPKLINMAYKRTEKELLFAVEKGVPVIEVFLSDIVSQKSVDEAFSKILTMVVPKDQVSKESTQSMFKWGNRNIYDDRMIHYQIPPQKYILGVSNKQGKRKEFSYQKLKNQKLYWNNKEKEQIRLTLAEAYQILDKRYSYGH